MNFANMKKLSIGGIQLKSLAINGLQVWTGVNNIIASSINKDGTPYRGTNGEIGYKNGVRLGNSGDETAVTGYATTGYIPVAPKDKLYFSVGCMPYISSSRNMKMALYDASFAWVGTISTVDLYDKRTSTQLINDGLSHYSDNSLSTVTAYAIRYWLTTATANKTAYVRFCSTNINANAVITKNEPLA